MLKKTFLPLVLTVLFGCSKDANTRSTGDFPFVGEVTDTVGFCHIMGGNSPYVIIFTRQDSTMIDSALINGVMISFIKHDTIMVANLPEKYHKFGTQIEFSTRPIDASLDSAILCLSTNIPPRQEAIKDVNEVFGHALVH